MVDHSDITWEQTQDSRALKTNKQVYKKYSRDSSRTPFQWDDTSSSGFSTSTNLWLPVHQNYHVLNLKAQLDKKESHVEIYKKLAIIRKHKTLTHGEIIIKTLERNVFGFARFLENSDTFAVIINLDEKMVNIDLSSLFGGLVRENMNVELTCKGSGYNEGLVIDHIIF